MKVIIIVIDYLTPNLNTAGVYRNRHWLFDPNLGFFSPIYRKFTTFGVFVRFRIFLNLHLFLEIVDLWILGLYKKSKNLYFYSNSFQNLSLQHHFFWPAWASLDNLIIFMLNQWTDWNWCLHNSCPSNRPLNLTFSNRDSNDI